MTSRHPWPTPAGTAQEGSTPVRLRGGDVRWSVELGHRLASNIVADAEGRWFARSEGIVVAGDALTVLWRRAANVLRPSILHDGSLVLPCADAGLAVVQPGSGAEVWSVPGYCWAASPTDSDGLAVLVSVKPDWSLLVVESGGAQRWSRSTGIPVAAPLVGDDGTVVSVSKYRLEAFDRDGRALWNASPAGFETPPDQGRFTTQAVALDDARVLVGVDSSWLGYLIVNPAARTAVRWPPGGDRATPASPLAVRRSPQPLGVVTWLQTKMLVMAVDGLERRIEQLRNPPYAYAVDPSGAIAVAYTLDADYHDRYLWYDEGRALRGQSGVALFDPDGQCRWIWDAPGPLGGFAISAEGEILVTSEGRLWAIG